MENTFRSGNLERGWNDPPELLHQGTSQNVSQNCKKLNQRVSHNFDGIIEKKVEAVLTEPPKLIVEKCLVEDLSNDKEEKTAEEMTAEEIEKIFIIKVEFCKENSLSAKMCEEILKRIKILLNNWPKLNEKVKLKMSELARCLENENLAKADEIHIQLMMDYPSEVVSWMVGIKKLIHQLTNIVQLTNSLK